MITAPSPAATGNGCQICGERHGPTNLFREMMFGFRDNKRDISFFSEGHLVDPVSMFSCAELAVAEQRAEEANVAGCESCGAFYLRRRRRSRMTAVRSGLKPVESVAVVKQAPSRVSPILRMNLRFSLN
jgi:hypothetical protein